MIEKYNARDTALQILIKIERNNAWSSLSINSHLENSGLSAEDKALAASLVTGVIERLYTLDYNLSLCLKRPLSRLKPRLLAILRVAAYQLLCMDKIPASAAVNEAVKQAKTYEPYAAGLVNAVLRKLAENGTGADTRPAPAGINHDAGLVKYFKIKYSVSEHLAELLIKDYGADTAETFLSAAIEKPLLYIRANTLKTDAEGLKAALLKDGAEAEGVDGVKNALILKSPGNITRLKAFRDGFFHVQDLSSQVCAMAVNPQKGDAVTDVCSAPGGKAFTMAQYMENTGEIAACDIYPHKIKLIEDGIERLGIKNIKTLIRDASATPNSYFLTPNSYDKVICDAPCSGFGVIGRKPEIKYKTGEEIASLPGLQFKILENSAELVKKGGTLTYSVCTLGKAETVEVADSFLENNKDFESVKVLPDVKRDEPGDYLTVLPDVMPRPCDGFFIAQFIRQNFIRRMDNNPLPV
ncbi:MAG: 16S rRNA (cytosine(967)-C(5))-methyltransferase RsmB [Oscillospiraceae bacterium]|nr:16S rRNA (cytosine(967)-C(5))-methyltransferase RsmB [Oscillospiraceae bacterium]